MIDVGEGGNMVEGQISYLRNCVVGFGFFFVSDLGALWWVITQPVFGQKHKYYKDLLYPLSNLKVCLA